MSCPEPTLTEPALHPQSVAELRLHPEALDLSLEDLPPVLRQDNFSLPNSSALLQQLDTIDNAACGWIQFMSKVCSAPVLTPAPVRGSGLPGATLTMPIPQVSVDIFKGFPDEESIVNYTLNQAYQDNVTVFASEPGSPTLLLVGPVPSLGPADLEVPPPNTWLLLSPAPPRPVCPEPCPPEPCCVKPFGWAWMEGTYAVPGHLAAPPSLAGGSASSG